MRRGAIWVGFIITLEQINLSPPLNNKLWEKIHFHMQNCGFPMKNWNLGRMGVLCGRRCLLRTQRIFQRRASAWHSCHVLLVYPSLAADQAISLCMVLLGNVRIFQTAEWFFLQSSLTLEKFIYSSYAFLHLLILPYSCQSHLVSP